MGTLSLPQLVARARGGGFQGEEAAIAAAIAMAESGGNPLAHNPNASTGDNSYGLWQVNMLDRMGPERRKQFGLRGNEELFNPEANARAAKQIKDSQGFGAWSVYKSGKYLDYLPQAKAALSDPSAGAGAGSTPAPQPGSSKAAPAQGSEVSPLQAFTNDLLARMNGGGAASSGSLAGEQPATFTAPESPSIDRVRGDLISQITRGGFASEGLAGGSFGIPSALEAPSSSPRPERRMAGEQLGVQPPDMMKSLLPGLLAGIFGGKKQAAPVAAAAAAPAAQGGKGAGQGAAGGSWGQGPAVAAFHPETGDGYTVPGARDANGRPVVFGRSAANAFAAMMRDSKGLVKPGDIASAQRSESKNAAVGGAVGSHHLGGNAMDIHGASHDWIANNGARYGWHLHRYGGAGDHGGHFEFRG